MNDCGDRLAPEWLMVVSVVAVICWVGVMTTLGYVFYTELIRPWRQNRE